MIVSLLNAFRRQADRQLKYADAKRARTHLKPVQERELQRQSAAMESAQEEEYREIERQQNMQFAEFSHAWDEYMGQYERAAVISVQRLKGRHVQESEMLRETIIENTPIKYTLSKELMNVRA